MFKIYDGRETFYQWDINQKLIVEDDSITEVHFSNRSDNYSLVCDIQNEGDLRVVSVPNVLLQTNWPIRVYAYRKDHTEVSETFKVIEKDKPEDYVYTPDEVKTWEELNNRITELEKPANSVLYTAQELTEEQKAQARQNVGSFDIFDLPNLIKFNVKSKILSGDKIMDGVVFALNDFQPIDINTADTETVEAWRTLFHTFSFNDMQTLLGNTDMYIALAFLIDKNMFGENFYSTHTYSNCAWFGRNHKFMKFYSWATSDPAQKIISGYVYDLEKSVGEFKYKALTNELEWFSYSYPLTALASTSTNGKEIISQINMRADPTEPMQIATKQYVDNSIAAGGTNISLGLTSVAVGQTIKVKAVDENGKPTEWEAVDMAGGGVDKNLRWAQVLEMTTTEQMNIITADKDPEGRTFASYNAIAMLTVLSIPADSTQTSANGTVWVTAQPIGYNSRASINIANWKTNSRTISQCHLGTVGGLVWCGSSNSGTMTSTNRIDNIFTVVKIEVHNADDHLPIGTTVRIFLLSEENA